MVNFISCYLVDGYSPTDLNMGSIDKISEQPKKLVESEIYVLIIRQ